MMGLFKVGFEALRLCWMDGGSRGVVTWEIRSSSLNGEFSSSDID
jgi:hypothetical protein